ncbi:hypothetical protein AB990_18195 [Alkalihalobacillus pseudalcaliphilus]|nr:hypothetical protein AB990_18195 [Alkalihalobacillus pseudalcaliphilus]
MPGDKAQSIWIVLFNMHKENARRKRALVRRSSSYEAKPRKAIEGRESNTFVRDIGEEASCPERRGPKRQ